MENRRNLIIAVILCIGILVVWDRFFLPKPQVPSPASQTQEQKADPAQPSAAQPKPASAQAAAAEGGRGAEQTVDLQTEDARFVFSTWGASLKAVYLVKDKFKGRKGDDRPAGAPLEILRARSADTAPFRIGFANTGFDLPADAAWRVVEHSDSRVIFEATAAGATIRKTFATLPQSYRLSLQVTVKNESQTAQKHRLSIHIPGYQEPSKKGGGLFSYAIASVEEMVCEVDGSIKRNSVPDLVKEARDLEGVIRWVAADERFFTVAAVAPLQDMQTRRLCRQTASNEDDGEVVLTLAEESLKSGGEITYPFALYTGPKYRQQLAEVSASPVVGGAPPKGALTNADVELDASVNVTFAFISRPMMLTLRAFFRLTGNWGLAIILLTLLVKLVTFYPAHKALLSGKRMARLAPKVAELKEKLGNDRERLGRETMALYKSQGVNVLGGCVPSLIQMPIWIALYSTLSYSVELYRANFVGYIHDLSAPDPYYLLPLVMGVTMFVQMRMTPAGTDPQQQKIMSVMMPVMFTFFQVFLPSGLALYVLTNYLLGIVHQMIINRLEKRSNPPANPPSKVAKAAR